jgi:hypothetical protein
VGEKKVMGSLSWDGEQSLEASFSLPLMEITNET